VRSKWATGAALIVARDEFIQLGGFSAEYFLYYEDRDLSVRYSKQGYSISSTTALDIVHSRGQSTQGRDVARSAAWGLLGMVEFIYHQHGLFASRLSARTVLVVLNLQALLCRGSAKFTSRSWATILRRKDAELVLLRATLIALSQDLLDGRATWCTNAACAIVDAQRW
jgi:GT2 family glycosyltransferase